MALAMVDHGYILLRCGVGGLGGGIGTVALGMVDHGYILLRCGVGGLWGGGGWHCGFCHGWPWIHSAEVHGWVGGYRFENWNTTTVLRGFLALVQIVTGLLDYEKKKCFCCIFRKSIRCLYDLEIGFLCMCDSDVNVFYSKLASRNVTVFKRKHI